MAIPLYGSTGSLFNRLGKLGVAVKNINSFQSTLKTTLIDTTNGITSQYAAEPDLQAEIGNVWINTLNGLEGAGPTVQQLAADTCNRMVFRDNPRINQTLTTANLLASINEIIRQMNAQGATVLQMTVTATPGSFVGTGTGAVVASVKRPLDGRTLENAFAETILLTCTADSYIGRATAFNEQFTVTGTGVESDVFAFDWPLGSNGQITLNAIDGDTSNGSGNLLTNSGFKNWTSNIPNNWVLKVGTAGTNIVQNSSIIYSVGSSCELLGDSSSTLTSIQQQFNNSTGTSAALSPQTQYSVNLWARTGGTSPTQGVLQIDLVDGGGTIIKDQNAVSNSFTIDLTTLNTVWTAFNGVFRTPEILPAQQNIRLHLTTSLPNGIPVYLDKLGLGVMSQLATQGPFLSIHAGNTAFVQSSTADYATCAITNSRGSGGTLATMQTLFYRLLPVAASNEILLPSSSAPTISDSLIG